MWGAFQGLEILTFATEIEKNGCSFYQTMAEKVTDPATKSLFLALAHEEAQHIQDFQALMDRVDDYQAMEEYGGEYMDYVRDMVSQHVFSSKLDADELAKVANDPRSAIAMAARFEKDTIVFFSELKRTVFKDHEGVIETLIEQELEHLSWLSKKKRELFS